MTPVRLYLAIWAAILWPPLLLAYAVAAVVWLAVRTRY